MQGNPSNALSAPLARQPLVSSSLSSGALPHLTATCVLLACVPAEGPYVSYAAPQVLATLLIETWCTRSVPGTLELVAPKYRYYKWLSKPPTWNAGPCDALQSWTGRISALLPLLKEGPSAGSAAAAVRTALP